MALSWAVVLEVARGSCTHADCMVWEMSEREVCAGPAYEPTSWGESAVCQTCGERTSSPPGTEGIRAYHKCVVLAGFRRVVVW